MRAAVVLAMLGAGVATAVDGQTWSPCLENGPRARCATIEVPEDRTRPDGRRIGLAVAVLEAARPGGREPVVFFGGGPGGGSIELAELANGPYAEVRKTRDVLLVDQRGTGGSNGLLCRIDLSARPALAFGHLFNPEVFRRCRDSLATHADLRFYGTERAVEDLEDLRVRLGYDRLVLWGGSYGTRMAQAYLRRHPDRVAAVVLDGVVPFDFRAPSGYARSLQDALDRVVDDCLRAPRCRGSFPDPAQDFDQIVERLRRGPVAARIRMGQGREADVQLSLGDFGYAVRGLLYSAANARELPAQLHEAATSGRLDVFAQKYWQRAAEFDAFADGLHLTVFCSEDVPLIPEGQVDSLTSGAFIGRYLIDEYRTACDGWPIGERPADFEQPMTAPAPVLLLSGWFDPVTPSRTGEAVARLLPNSRHLVVRDEAHGAGFRCARRAVLHVLVKATLEGLPGVCRGVMGLWD